MLYITPWILTQSSSFSLGLHQTQDVVFSDRSLDVSYDGSGSVFQELDSDLGHTTSGTGSAQHFNNFGQSNWRFSVHAVYWSGWKILSFSHRGPMVRARPQAAGL